MSAAAPAVNTTTDRVDRQIIHCIQRDGRASFARIAHALDVSEQTVARRYRRLLAEGVMRVVALPYRLDPEARLWTVRLTCRPGATTALADALARRTDTAWVTITAGGSEIFCSLVSREADAQDDLLLSRLPRTNQVLNLSAHTTLHRFTNDVGDDWCSFGDRLEPDRLERLGPRQYTYAVAPQPGIEPIRPDDADLVAALGRDARLTWAQLSAATGWSEGRVRRRTEALLSGGGLYVDVDLSAHALGFGTSTLMWLSVTPAALAETGQALRDHDEVTFAAAITGPANLLAATQCRTTADFYRYVTTRVATLSGVTGLELSPVLRVVKQAGTLMDGTRLAVGAPPPKQTYRAVG